jgi:pSer/pThr/pTyr-binding forkhead associated (FHA) protein
MATIYVTKGPHDGDAFTIGSSTVVVGRGEECGITLDDEKTSRAHLQVTFDEATGCHSAEDLRSTNGSWHNGKSMTTAVALADGDMLELGKTALEFCAHTYPSNNAAKAARTSSVGGGQPTMIDTTNKPF